MIGSILSTAGKFVTDTLPSVLGFVSNERTNRQNHEEWQANFDYTKALQQQLFQREDSAYQRTVNDMRAAGLSPLMMSGTNGSGEAIATTPFESKPFNSFSLGDPITSGIEIEKQLKDIGYVDEQIKSVKLANARAELENKFLSEDYVNRIATSIANRILAENKSSDSSRNESFNKHYNISNDMPDTVKVERIARQVAKDIAPEIQTTPTNRDDELEALRASAEKLPIIGGLFKKARSENKKIVKDERIKSKKANSSHAGKGRTR